MRAGEGESGRGKREHGHYRLSINRLRYELQRQLDCATEQSSFSASEHMELAQNIWGDGVCVHACACMCNLYMIVYAHVYTCIPVSLYVHM